MSDISDNWRGGVLPVSATLRDAINNLNESSLKIVLIVNEQGQLQGTVSDGDIRRGLLGAVSLDSPIVEVLHTNPFIVPEGMERDLVVQIMVANKIQQLPIVNSDNQLVGLHQWDDVAVITARLNTLVIMAGGKGTRLQPHTENCPKPMLEVAGKPMLEHIIERAKADGFQNFVISVHYMGHMIKDYFGDGAAMGISISYLNESEPLGTAGALSLLDPKPSMPIVVSNGDVISDIRYSDLLDFHERHDAAATMTVKLHEIEHQFGVVNMNGIEISGFEEKPVIQNHINAGVYVLDPGSVGELVHGDHCDMPSLFERLRLKGHRIVAYPMHEPWLDVGRPNDLAKANGE